LQVIQIFAYLVYFKPVLLLVDEPDSHLHPATQELLIGVLADAAKRQGTQVILTTHSPSVVRALPSDARVIWMKNGTVQRDGNTSGRKMMGWGLLDKRILLLTEDTKTGMLRSLLSQWADLERIVALWPLHGSGKLLDAQGCSSLQNLFGEDMKIILHRDRDFMMPLEAAAFKKPYDDKGISVWLSKHSDIESYWCEPEVISAHFSIDITEAKTLLLEAVTLAQYDNADFTSRNNSRDNIRNNLSSSAKSQIDHFNDCQIIEEYSKHGHHHVILGKNLCKKIRDVAHEQQELQDYQSFGKIIPWNPTAGC